MSHDIADARSRALHRAVATKLRTDPSIVARARERVASWRQDGTTHERYREEWERILTGSPTEIAEVLERDDELARELRQASPFAGALTARERWALLRSI